MFSSLSSLFSSPIPAAVANPSLPNPSVPPSSLNPPFLPAEVKGDEEKDEHSHASTPVPQVLLPSNSDVLVLMQLIAAEADINNTACIFGFKLLLRFFCQGLGRDSEVYDQVLRRVTKQAWCNLQVLIIEYVVATSRSAATLPPISTYTSASTPLPLLSLTEPSEPSLQSTFDFLVSNNVLVVDLLAAIDNEKKRLQPMLTKEVRATRNREAWNKKHRKGIYEKYREPSINIQILCRKLDAHKNNIGILIMSFTTKYKTAMLNIVSKIRTVFNALFQKKDEDLTGAPAVIPSSPSSPSSLPLLT